MNNLLNKANAPYLAASSLATLTLISSLVLAITSNVHIYLILNSVVLSALVIVLSCRIIRNNMEVETDKDEFAKKEHELENKITLAKEAGETANRQVEKLKNQLNKLTQEKQGSESKIESLNREIDCLRKQQTDAQQELNYASRMLNYKENQIQKLYKETKFLEELLEELDRLQCEVARLTKENTNLSRELREKLKKLDDVNDLLKSQFVELEEIMKSYNNKEKKLHNLLLEESSEKIIYKEALQKRKKEEMDFVYETIEHVISKIEELLKGSEEIRYDDKQVILQIIIKTRSIFEENAVLYLTGGTSREEVDAGYRSMCSTPERLCLAHQVVYTKA